MNALNILGRIVLFSSMSVFLACTPKVGQETTQEDDLDVTKDTIADISDGEILSPCVKFNESKRREDALDAYSIYGDFINLDQYTESFEYWKTVYKYAPAGFGKRPDIFTDGILYYNHFYETSNDPEQKKEYLNRIFELYDEAIDCFPHQKAQLIARRAFDYYYNYPEIVSKKEIFDELKFVVNEMGDATPVYAINPFTALIYNSFKDTIIEADTCSKYAYKVFNIIQANKDNIEDADQWEIVENYSLQLLSYLEGEENFFPCAYYKKVYLPLYYDNTQSCDTVQLVYGKLKWGGCSDEPVLSEMEERLQGDCKEIDVSEEGSLKAAITAYQSGKYREAIKGFEVYIEQTEDLERKAKYSLLIAKIYFSHMRQFSNARTWAQKAAEYKKAWGEPYILIGKLYASSGSLCGPGTGWDSQIVVWPAIDKWNQAKRIDPSVTREANQLIQEYEKYMPSVADIFSRTHIKEGDSFRVECWIQETTTVRAAPR